MQKKLSPKKSALISYILSCDSHLFEELMKSPFFYILGEIYMQFA